MPSDDLRELDAMGNVWRICPACRGTCEEPDGSLSRPPAACPVCCGEGGKYHRMRLDSPALRQALAAASEKEKDA